MQCVYTLVAGVYPNLISDRNELAAHCNRQKGLNNAELPPEWLEKTSRQIRERLEREEIIFADWQKKQKGMRRQ
ncbi:MAG: hypothetical protein A2Y65_02480 [Deltaproteobacteria bacterium RBG_13_52_11]|nr:MAG: hypothetical protein A2Y65_02480 [Deltaproteobacteria bacterium RBG_13_52_11]